MPSQPFPAVICRFTRQPANLARAAACAGARIAAATIIGALLVAPALAEKADRNQPLNFSADSARVDDTRKVNVLTGNVEITKGTMVFRAARVEVRQNADGSQTAHAWGSPGARAYFRQKREGLDEYIEGEGDQVEYNGRNDTVRFTGHAAMRRMRGATLADEVVGQIVLYDNRSEVFQVVGGGTGPGTSSGRVRGVITPRPNPKDDTEPETPRGNAPALTPSSSLSRPTPEGSR